MCFPRNHESSRTEEVKKDTHTLQEPRKKKRFHRRVIVVPARKMYFQLKTCQEIPNLGPRCIPGVVAQGWQKPSLSPSVGRMTQSALFWEVGLVGYPNHPKSIGFLLAIKSSYMASRLKSRVPNKTEKWGPYDVLLNLSHYLGVQQC